MDKRNRDRLVGELFATVVAYGGRPSEIDPTERVIQTRAGTLRVKRIEASRELASVFTAFDTPAMAALFTDCNPYSGKWNFHMTIKGKADRQAVVRAFESQIRSVCG